ncbi:hypothetical protein ACFPA8_27640 [Streptomyces ovatisporus]|uniref:Uncharacterized protein n=1 Tax=Streptomyces ovatisporus TaxID=1128682 RepID=A0ABV9AJX7_9ACTN
MTSNVIEAMESLAAERELIERELLEAVIAGDDASSRAEDMAVRIGLIGFELDRLAGVLAQIHELDPVDAHFARLAPGYPTRQLTSSRPVRQIAA